MSAVAATIQALLDDATVTGVVSTRIYPLVLPQTAVPPAIVVTMAAEIDPGEHLAGIGAILNTRVNVQCLSTDPAQVMRLGESVRAALHGRAGTFNSWSVQFRKAENDMTDHDENRTIFRRVIGFRVWWRTVS